MTISPGHLVRRARSAAGLTLRALGTRAGTSHSTLAAYEAGRKAPGTETLRRIVQAAGYELDVDLRPLPGGDPDARGHELIEVLELASMFPAHHDPVLRAPIFGRR